MRENFLVRVIAVHSCGAHLGISVLVMGRVDGKAIPWIRVGREINLII